MALSKNERKQRAIALFTQAVDLLIGDADEGQKFFTSEHPAPGVTRRAFNEWCRSGKVDGALQEPDGTWRCSADAWFAARYRKPTRAPAANLGLIAPESSDDEAVLAGASFAAGMRSTRRRSA